MYTHTHTCTHTEAVPALIDSWARGVVPSATLSTLDTTMDTLDPVRVTTSLPPVAEDDTYEESIESSRPCSELRGSTGVSMRKSAPLKVQANTFKLSNHNFQYSIIIILFAYVCFCCAYKYSTAFTTLCKDLYRYLYDITILQIPKCQH